MNGHKRERVFILCEIRGSQSESSAAVCSVRPEKPRQWSRCSSTCTGGECVRLCVHRVYVCVGAFDAFKSVPTQNTLTVLLISGMKLMILDEGLRVTC